jgi:hypothetical protein
MRSTTRRMKARGIESPELDGILDRAELLVLEAERHP